MRYAILADIHSNLESFTAVLKDIEQHGGADEIWCLGDVVGYGSEPHQCIGLLRQHNHFCVAGNHDWASIGKLNTSYFNPDAAAVAQWTAKQLTPEDMKYLQELPTLLEGEEFTMVHGSPREPLLEYLLSISTAKENFSRFNTTFCLVGHSHVPVIFKYEKGEYTSSKFLPNIAIALGEDRAIINPGSVGQPRDGDPRASYALYDDEAKVIRLHRVEYDFKATQAKMIEQKLPVSLVARLGRGI